MLCIVVYIGIDVMKFELSCPVLHLLPNIRMQALLYVCVSTLTLPTPSSQPILSLTWIKESHSNMPHPFFMHQSHYLPIILVTNHIIFMLTTINFIDAQMTVYNDIGVNCSIDFDC